jgi:hypothetical protein
MSPLVCGSSMGLRSVRFSESHGRVLAVCMFCTREPSFSHPAPCALFVSARGTRHAFAFVGLAPKFFRWNHGAPHRMETTNPRIKSEAAWQFQHSYKKDMVRRSNEGIEVNQVWKWRLLNCSLPHWKRTLLAVGAEDFFLKLVDADGGFFVVSL